MEWEKGEPSETGWYWAGVPGWHEVDVFYWDKNKGVFARGVDYFIKWPSTGWHYGPIPMPLPPSEGVKEAVNG